MSYYTVAAKGGFSGNLEPPPRSATANLHKSTQGRSSSTKGGRATQCGLKDAHARAHVFTVWLLCQSYQPCPQTPLSSSCVCLNLLIRHASVHTRTLQRKFSHIQRAFTRPRRTKRNKTRLYLAGLHSLPRIKIIARHFLYRPPKSGRANALPASTSPPALSYYRNVTRPSPAFREGLGTRLVVSCHWSCLQVRSIHNGMNSWRGGFCTLAHSLHLINAAHINIRPYRYA